MKYNKLYPENYIFIPETTDTINLSDQIIIYFDGIKWKIIPLLVCMAYPVIYDFYYINDKKIPVTIIVCPVSLRSILVKGRFVLNSYVKENKDISSVSKINKHDDKIKLKNKKTKLIIRESSSNYLMPIDVGVKMDPEHYIHTSKRSEVQIMTLKDAILFAPDPLYIHINVPMHKPVVNLSYYTNKNDMHGGPLNSNTEFHPKTIVRLIRCETSDILLIGSDAELDVVTGYNISKSTINTYFLKEHDMLVQNKCFIINVLLYIGLHAYPSCKLVKL